MTMSQGEIDQNEANGKAEFEAAQYDLGVVEVSEPDWDIEPDSLPCDLCKTDIGPVWGSNWNNPDVDALNWRVFWEVAAQGDLAPRRFCEDCVIWLTDVAPALIESAKNIHTIQ